MLPQAGLDELDEFLLKKIGMISHCGFEQNMRIVANNITDELMCTHSLTGSLTHSPTHSLLLTHTTLTYLSLIPI